MYDKIIEEIKKNTGISARDVEDDRPYFSDKRYKPHKIDKGNFHQIAEIPSSKRHSSKRIAFVDGGNAELLKTENISLQLIRAYCAIYMNNKRIGSKRKEFFALANSVGGNGNNNELNYNVTISKNDLISDKLLFGLHDETLREGFHTVNISKVGETIRRFAELRLAESVMGELSNGLIVLDGSLQGSVTHENSYFESLYSKALKNNVTVTGLSKTTSLITEKGSSFASALSSLAPKGKWYYHPIVDITHPCHQAEMFFVKLHNGSRHIFRFEVHKGQEFDINEILGILAANSKDPVFLGYPYGLIEADRLARVSNNEKEYWKTVLHSKLGFIAKDAHSILDNLS